MKDIDTIVIAVGGQGRRIATDPKGREIKTSKIFLELNGKPFLGYLLDMSLALNFRKIFLLSSYYERELRVFLKENYLTANQIIPIYGGKSGRKWGVPWLLYSIRQELKNPFVYSDGNILYDKSVLKKIKTIAVLQSALANVVLSRKDLAPTHSRFILQGKQIKSVDTRLLNNKENRETLKGRQFYSLGLMTLSRNIFSFVSGFAYKKDLDFVISDIFRLDENMVEATIYKGSWIAVHNMRDVDKLGIKS
jgi:NDP-sugar pyrophosphorylase family protein